MSDHVVEFIKRVGENDKMRVLPSNLSRFRNEVNKFSNTGARMLVSIYHMALESLKTHLESKNVRILPLVTQRYNRRHYGTLKNL